MVILGDHVAIGERRLPGWSAARMFYAFKCPKHGVVIDCIPGYENTPFCPKCVDEKRRLIK